MMTHFLKSNHIKKFLYIFITITILHTFLLVSWIAKDAKDKTMENNTIYEFVNTIELVSENVSAAKTKEIFETAAREDIGFEEFIVATSLSQIPSHKNLFYKKEDVKSYLSSAAKEIRFSLKLKNNYWLNLSVTPSSNFYTTALFYMMAEFLIIIVILLFLWSLWRFTRPLYALKHDLKKIGENLNIVIPNNQNAPLLIQELSAEINRMQCRIQGLLNSRTKLIAAISHDLRTPLTRLRLILQFIPEAQSEKIMNNLTEMEKMIESILAFTVIDNAYDKQVNVDVCALLNSLYEDFSDMGHHIHLESCQSRPVTYGKFLALKRAFTNIIENALKYAHKITISLIHLNENKIKILFQDDGPGIPEDKLNKVFEAYYRVNSHERRGIKGMGLGLTIAEEIISAHGGTITLENRVPTGLQVSIILSTKSDKKA